MQRKKNISLIYAQKEKHFINLCTERKRFINLCKERNHFLIYAKKEMIS